MPDGFRTFTAGATLTAAQVQGYLMEQVIAVFADATARDAAITSPEEGMHAYLNDSNTVTYYDGAAWKVLPGGVTTAGDVAYFDGTSWVRLPIGTAGQVLKTNAGATAPEWGAEAAAGDVAFLGSTVDSTSQTGISTTFTAVASLTVSPSTGKVTIFANARYTKKGSAGRVLLRIFDTTAGAAVQHDSDFGPMAVDDFNDQAMWRFHTPGAGSRTYELRMVVASAGTVDKQHAMLMAVEG